MAKATLTLNIRGKLGIKELLLQLMFNYGDYFHELAESIDGSDYSIEFKEIGEKEFIYEEDSLVVIPAMMDIKLLDTNGRLGGLLLEGTPLSEYLTYPFGQNILTDKNIKAVYSVDGEIILEGFVKLKDVSDNYKKRELLINLSPETEILKRRKVSFAELDYDMKIKDILRKFLLPVYPDLTNDDILILNDCEYFGEMYDADHVPHYFTIEGKKIDDLYIPTTIFFDPESTLYEALKGLAECFFSQILIDNKIIFKKQNLSLPIDETIILEDFETLTSLKREGRSENLDYVTIKHNGGNYGPLNIYSSFSVGDTTLYGIEKTILFKFVSVNAYLSGSTMYYIRKSNIRIYEGGREYFVVKVKDPRMTEYKMWAYYIAYQWYYFKNASRNSPLYILKTINIKASFNKNYNYKFSYYTPIALSVDTVSGKAEIKCLRVPTVALPEVPEIGGSDDNQIPDSYTGDGMVLNEIPEIGEDLHILLTKYRFINGSTNLYRNGIRLKINDDYIEGSDAQSINLLNPVIDNENLLIDYIRL